MSDTTWRAQLETQRSDAADVSPILAYAPNEEAFDVVFDDNYGGTEGQPVLAWSGTHVYFPVCYDGAEWLGSAPRNPQNDGQSHVGGG
jgi:hypothetical protein